MDSDAIQPMGRDAHIEIFHAFSSGQSPHTRNVAPTQFKAKLDEPTLLIDSTSKQKNEQFPSYKAYPPDVDLTAPLVYVNCAVVENDEEPSASASVKGQA
jgi:hypothetical protein